MTPEERAHRSAEAMWSTDRASKWFGMEIVSVSPAVEQVRVRTPEVRVTRVENTADEGIEIVGVTSDGIEIIEAEVATPPASGGGHNGQAAQDGIVFLD